jgi:hypothetical protein
VWRDSSNTWRCFKDSCPHRAAPLSGGSPGRCHVHARWLFASKALCIDRRCWTLTAASLNAPACLPACLPACVPCLCRGQDPPHHQGPRVCLCKCAPASARKCTPRPLLSCRLQCGLQFSNCPRCKHLLSIVCQLPAACHQASPHHAAPPVSVQHGWQFEGSGAARELPQSEPGSAKATACASKRSCATSFPTAEAHGLLFVWLEGGAEGQAQAAAAPLPSLPAADHTGKEWFPVSTWCAWAAICCWSPSGGAAPGCLAGPLPLAPATAASLACVHCCVWAST